MNIFILGELLADRITVDIKGFLKNVENMTIINEG